MTRHLAAGAVLGLAPFFASALVVLFCCLLLGGNAAWAHATLVDTVPVAGAVLERAPTAVTLTFNEPISPASIQLFDPAGHKLALAPTRARGPQLQIALPDAAAARGSYLLSWRVVSADGHPVGGVLHYAVGATSAQPAVQAAAGTRHGVAIWLARWLTYLCLFAVAGAVLFRPFARTTTLPWIRPLAWAGLALLLLDLALQGLDLQGAGWLGLLSAQTWSAALVSSYAWTLAFLALALLLALSVLRATWPANTVLAAFAVPLLVAGALALSGHAATAPPQWLARPTVALHVLMVLAWVGSLVPLARALKPAGADQGGPDLRVLARFSGAITWVVALLVASGVVLVGLQLDEPGDLWRSDYGRVLLAKLALVALLLLLAAANRWLWTDSALAGSLPALRALRRAMAVELVLAACVLAVVALWRFTPPPRSLAAAGTVVAGQASKPGLEAPVVLQDPRVRARIAPATSGTPWTIALQAPDGTPFAARDVTLMLDNPQAGISAMHLAARQTAPGRWQVVVPALPPTGRWQPALLILIDDFDQIRLQAALAPPGAGVAHGHGDH